MYKFFLIIIFLLETFSAFSQFETPPRTATFGAEGTSTGSFIKPKEFSTGGINYTPKFSFDENATPESLSQNKKPDLTHDDGLMKNKMEYNPKWLEREGNEIKEEYKINQYFGDFKTNNKRITIMCRDHEYVDGDLVRVYQNDKIIVNEISLIGEFKKFFIELEPGFNKIEFVALNEGLSSPNTAEFQVWDDNGNLMIKNIWNLATGVKASIIVIQE